MPSPAGCEMAQWSGKNVVSEKIANTTTAQLPLLEELQEELRQKIDFLKTCREPSKTCREPSMESKPSTKQTSNGVLSLHNVLFVIFQHLCGTTVLNSNSVCKLWNETSCNQLETAKCLISESYELCTKAVSKLTLKSPSALTTLPSYMKDQISFCILEKISKLSGLGNISLYNAMHHRSLPSAIGLLTNLRALRLHNSKLTGVSEESILCMIPARPDVFSELFFLLTALLQGHCQPSLAAS